MFACKIVDVDFLATARHRFYAEETITATPEQIFEVFEDPHSWTVWATPIQRVEWTSPKPFGIGTTRTVSMSGNLVGEEVFIAWERGKRMAFCFTTMSQNSIESFAEDYQVTDLGNGTCKVQWTMAMQPKGFSKVMLAVFGPIMAWYNRRMFSSFRKYVESQYNSGSTITGQSR